MLSYSMLFGVIAGVCALFAFGGITEKCESFALVLAGVFALLGFATLAFDRADRP